MNDSINRNLSSNLCLRVKKHFFLMLNYIFFPTHLSCRNLFLYLVLENRIEYYLLSFHPTLFFIWVLFYIRLIVSHNTYNLFLFHYKLHIVIYFADQPYTNELYSIIQIYWYLFLAAVDNIRASLRTTYIIPI